MQVFIVTLSVDEQESFDSVHLSLDAAKAYAKQEIFPYENLYEEIEGTGALACYQGELVTVNIYSSNIKEYPKQMACWNILKEHCKSLMGEGEEDDDFFLELFKAVLSDAAKLKVGGGYSYAGIGGGKQK